MPVSFRAAQAHLTTGLDPGEGLPGTLRPHRLSAAASADRRLEKPARNRRERQRIGKRVDTGRHHMNMIMDIAEEVMVLNFGEKLAEGVPNEIVKDKKVIDAYLGVS